MRRERGSPERGALSWREPQRAFVGMLCTLLVLVALPVATRAQAPATRDAQASPVGGATPLDSPAGRAASAPADAPESAAAAAPAGSPLSAAPAASAAEPPKSAQAPDPVFDILEYRVEGVAKLPTVEVERAVYPYLGERKTIKDALRAVDSLQRAYQKAGFLTVVVELPEQKVDGGVVRLRVAEGKVGRVRVTGARYYSLGAIKARAASIEPGQVPNFNDVRADLAQLNRSEDLRVAPVLKPGATPGTVDVDLRVNDQAPVHGDVDLNDRYSANTSHLRLTTSLRYDNLWQSGHSFGLQYQTAPQDPSQVQLLTGTYVIPLGQAGESLALYGLHSHSKVGVAGDLAVLGNGTVVGARYAIPLKASEGQFHSITLGFDYKRFRDDVVVGALSNSTPIQYAPLLAQYNASVKDATGTNQYSASANLGVRDLFGTRDSDFSNKRFDASANYVALRGEVSRTQSIGTAWNLLGKLDGQYASGPLINNEQFTAGGADSVRGYDEAEELGDDGVHAALELRRAIPYGWISAPVSEFYGLVFTEGATLRNKDVLPGQRSRFTLASAGLGVRMKAYKTLHFGLDLAYPMRAGVYTHAGDWRTSFNLDYEF